MLLFLVAAGVSLIFGVLKVINFAHGSFYMLGAYFTLTVYGATGSFVLAVLAAAVGVALFGLLFERLIISRVYGSQVLMQLLVCYGVILILDDLVKIIWGPEFKSLGMPAAFQKPPLLMGGGVVPVYYLFLIILTLRHCRGCWVLPSPKPGSARSCVPLRSIRAWSRHWGSTQASSMPACSCSAGFSPGSLVRWPHRCALSCRAWACRSWSKSFIVTVIGGMGSVAGALVGSLLIGLVRSFGTIGFPLFTEGLMFLLMAVVLVLKPSGLFGREG